jgi:competence protein ComEC
LVLIALWGYAGLTGASPSVLRATFMFSLFTLSNMLAQRTDHLNSLFAAAVVLLLWEPRMLLQAGFQLSFLAVLGIILFYKPLERLWSPRSQFLRKVWSLAIVSISAQLLTGPLSVHLFKAFPVWFLPANILVVTAAGLAVYGGVALLLLHKVPLFGALITWALTLLLRGVGELTAYFAALPGAYPAVRVDAWSTVLLYLLMFTVAAWLTWGWRRMRLPAAVCASLLLVSWNKALDRNEVRQAFTVYDVQGRLDAAMTVGESLVVLGDADSLARDPWALRRIERHQRSEGLRHIGFLPHRALFADSVTQQAGTLAAAGRWRSEHIDIAFLTADDSLRAPQKERFDVVVVSGLSYIAPARLERSVAIADRVVLAGDLRWKVRRLISEACARAAIPCHDIRSDGAFILEAGSR